RTARRYPIRFSCAVTARWAKMRFPSRPGNDLKTPRFALLALSYLAFISLGLPDTVIGVAWPSIRDRFGVSQAGLGFVLSVGVAGYVVSSVFAGRAVVAHGASYQVGYVLLACALGAMGLAFAATRRAWEDDAATGGGISLHAGAGVALRSDRVRLQIALFFIYTGLESGTGQWCFTVLREGRGLDIESAGAWTTAYWGSILAGRVVLGFVVDRIGADRLLRITTL